MEIKVNRKDFIQSLSLGASFSGKNKALTALDNVRIKVTSDVIKISSNDGELGINTVYYGATTDGDGEFFADPKLILNALNTLKTEDVTLCIIDNKTLEIKHKNGVFSIPLDYIEEYPTPKMDDDLVKAEIDSSILFNWIKEARQFISSDELRPIMSGILLYYKDGEFGVCASDGHKLYTNHTNCTFEFGDMNAVLSEKAFSTLLDTISGTEKTVIYFGERNVGFKAGNTSLICRKIEGRYPNFKAVIPNTHTIDCECEKSELQESLARVSTMSNAASLIKMTLDGMTCKLVAEDFDFSKKGEDIFNIISLTNAITIGFKGIFMKICLDTIHSDNVILELTDNSRAIIIRDLDCEEKTILLMPMAI